ncbi:MAG: type II secretion system protein [Candidatus Omnitrophica bacterium]|nr:type II secretion system protein [Candidatus Omnitrophota bacterium]
MKRRGFTLVELMLVVAIILVLATIALPNLLRSRLSASQAAAKTTLKILSTAYEAYAADNGGTYNISTNALTSTNPRYINKDYADGSERRGYTFTCAYDTNYYTCIAYCSMSNDGETYSIATGSVASW